MVFDPNKQLVNPVPPRPYVTITGFHDEDGNPVPDWNLGQNAHTFMCESPPPGLLTGMILYELFRDAFSAFYAPDPQPAWGIVQLQANITNEWVISVSYNLSPGGHIRAAWVGHSFLSHPYPPNLNYIFFSPCTQPPFMIIT